ncbi:hypothetical protein BDV95DRAFT_307820 [Massariosphaeria phaeospora]|uniref:Uncharacterized protein n=1 Tax=Massariosphaeria phaeospora TaxID=100035 RepID=A0A7C8MEM4_9PLEO|nr:hypothetical protein BDV95DRAFT_307820 [Massariosphaeria phaeospora]
MEVEEGNMLCGLASAFRSRPFIVVHPPPYAITTGSPFAHPLRKHPSVRPTDSSTPLAHLSASYSSRIRIIVSSFLFQQHRFVQSPSNHPQQEHIRHGQKTPNGYTHGMKVFTLQDYVTRSSLTKTQVNFQHFPFATAALRNLAFDGVLDTKTNLLCAGHAGCKPAFWGKRRTGCKHAGGARRRPCSAAYKWSVRNPVSRKDPGRVGRSE